MSSPPKYVILIPVFNAEDKIGGVLTRVLRQIAANNVLIVDDGSTDGSAQIAESFDVELIRQPENRGKGAALEAGLQYAVSQMGASAVVTIDADGQHRPEELPLFFRSFEQSPADLIIGNRRFDTAAMPFHRTLSNRLTSWLLSVKLGKKILDSQSGFRLYSARLIQKIKLETRGYETESEILIKAARQGLTIDFVPISTVYADEESHIHPVRDTLRFIRMFLRY